MDTGIETEAPAAAAAAAAAAAWPFVSGTRYMGSRAKPHHPGGTD